MAGGNVSASLSRQGELVAAAEGGLELALVDLVATELLADAPPRQTAMLGAAVDPATVLLQHADQVGPLDLLGKLLGQLLERAGGVEVEAEGLLTEWDDL